MGEAYLRGREGAGGSGRGGGGAGVWTGTRLILASVKESRGKEDLDAEAGI